MYPQGIHVATNFMETACTSFCQNYFLSVHFSLLLALVILILQTLLPVLVRLSHRIPAPSKESQTADRKFVQLYDEPYHPVSVALSSEFLKLLVAFCITTLAGAQETRSTGVKVSNGSGRGLESLDAIHRFQNPTIHRR